jgi:putative membrane fusion protein
MKKLREKDSIAIIVVVLLVLVYIFYECYSVTHIELVTQTAVTSTVYESIDAQALVIREEHVIDNSSGAVTIPAVSDGDKVKVGGNVAMSFSSSDSANAYSKYSEIEKQLEYYENLESQTVGQAVDVESINDEIDENVNEYIRSVSANEDISDASTQLNSSLIRRQLIIGENIDFTSIIQQLRTQAESYATSAKPSKYITTDESGVFSSYTDGCENLVDYEKATQLTVDDVKAALEKVDENTADTSQSIGKLVTSYVWYLETVVSADDVKDLSNGQKVTIALKDDDDTTLSVKIIDGAEPSVGADETLLILQCNDMSAQLSTLREEEIEIRYNTYTGIKVPAEALHVSDGKKGVYALISSQVKFREADVIYTDSDYVLLSYDESNDKGIRLYDKIIIQGKDLEDGKVYT